MPLVLHYNHRGEGLKDFNRIEYYSLIGIKPYGKSSASKGIKGRRKSIQFPFHKHHPLHATHFQYISSRQPTPIIMGKSPVLPKSPNDEKTANAFAFYWLTLYRPELTAYDGVEGLKPVKYDWNALVQWIYATERSKVVFHRLRLHSLQRAVYSLKATCENRDILNAYRREFSDVFSGSVGNGRREFAPDPLAEFIDDFRNETQQDLTSRSLTYCHQELKYCASQATAFQRIFPDTSSEHVHMQMNALLENNPHNVRTAAHEKVLQ